LVSGEHCSIHLTCSALLFILSWGWSMNYRGGRAGAERVGRRWWRERVTRKMVVARTKGVSPMGLSVDLA
jgi:hypothetical protein